MEKPQKKAHSVSVPHFYKNSTKILKKFFNKEGTLKSLIYQDKQKDFKRLLGLLSNVIESRSKLESALNKIELFKEEPKFDKCLALILACEALKKDQPLSGSCRPVQVINRYFDQLKEAYHNATEEDGPIQVKIRLPKYIRINTLLTNPRHIHKKLMDEGYCQIKYKKDITYKKFLSLVKNLTTNTYLEDFHMDMLLVFPADQEFWSSSVYKKHLIVIQDKASCLPPFLCDFKPYSNVIDACAAPGNKTSQIAAGLQNKGRVLALDRDADRHKLLGKFMKERGAKCVTTMKQDFTALKPLDYKEYSTIFVDPSCSNSGLTAYGEEMTAERLKSLSFFQTKLLCHALSFPSANTVVYSTCSIREEENEQVVEEALKQFGEQFILEDLQQKLKGWTNFGDDKYPFKYQCLRTNVQEDLCHGFFVAKFVRRSSIPLTSAEMCEQLRKKRPLSTQTKTEDSATKKIKTD